MSLIRSINILKLSVCIVSMVLASYATADQGIMFTSSDGRLSIWVPSKPRMKEDLIPSRTGGPYKRTTYAVEANNYILLAGIIDFRGDLATSGNEELYLNSMIENLRAGFGSRFVLDSKGGNIDILLPPKNLKGRQFKGMLLQGQRFIFRAYVVAHSIYILQVSYPSGDKSASKVAERFLSSLVVGSK